MSFLNLRFENDVKMYGTQAKTGKAKKKAKFENDAKLYGVQADKYVEIEFGMISVV